MTAGAPVIDAPVDAAQDDDSAAGGPPGRRAWIGAPSLEPPAEDDAQRRYDPADSVVQIGEVPPLRRPVRTLSRLLPAMPTDVARGWLITGAITVIGALVRFWQIGYRTDGGTPLFDEKYYAVQSAEMLRNGGVEDNQAYNVVVHPPLGKQLMAIGQWIFGYDPVGWRFASAVAGTLMIGIIIRVVRRMTRSTLIGGIAGVLLICDGVSHVMARTALLDVFQAMFVLAAFACVVADRDQVRTRLAAAVADGSGRNFTGGIPLGARWWRFGAGVLLGAATAVKWSGLYWVAAFGVLVVIWDITARREYGVRRPILAVFRRDLLPSLWSLLAVPVLTYVAAWWAWFASETGWARHEADGMPGFLPTAIRSLIHYTLDTLRFHEHLDTPIDPAQRHPWESKPWSWPLSTRPVLFYLSGGEGNTGCGAGHTDCVKRILLVGTPALWWISLFVAGWALWRAIGRVDWRYAAVLVGYGAGFLPWFINLKRQMYFFYMTPVAPFLVIGIALVLGDVLGRTRVGVERRFTAIAVVSIYVGLVVANFIWLLPILNGDPITPARLVAETWLPSWG